jgi:hypothetical protein
MATTTATITLSSSDLSSQALSISSTTTAFKSWVNNGIRSNNGFK